MQFGTIEVFRDAGLSEDNISDILDLRVPFCLGDVGNAPDPAQRLASDGQNELESGVAMGVHQLDRLGSSALSLGELVFGFLWQQQSAQEAEDHRRAMSVPEVLTESNCEGNVERNELV